MVSGMGFIHQSKAQAHVSGLYLSYNDYLNHKLNFATSDSKSTQIYFHEFIGWNNVTVMCDGKKQNFAKREIFGYHNYNTDYRYFENKAYQIVDTAGFCIYSTEKLVQQGKGPKASRLFFQYQAQRCHTTANPG